MGWDTHLTIKKRSVFFRGVGFVSGHPTFALLEVLRV